MSDELNKPNGQEQTDANTDSNRRDPPPSGPVEPGDFTQQPGTPLERRDATDQGLSNRDETGASGESQTLNGITDTAPEAENTPPHSNIPPEGKNAPGQGMADNAANHSEKVAEGEEKLVAGTADDQQGTANEPAKPEDDDLMPDLPENDLAVLRSYEEVLRPGEYGNDGECDAVPFQRSPMIDLIRYKTEEEEEIRVSLMEWTGSELSTFSCGAVVKYGNRNYYVPDLPPALRKSLPLPSKCGNYGTTAKLFGSIDSLLQNYLLLSEKQCALLTYWCIATWFPDVLHFIPRLTITGPKLAADFLFQTLRSCCRRPVLLAGMNSAALRAIPVDELMPTLFIRETSLSKRTAKLLDASDQRGYFVANGKQLQQCYCARCVYLGEDLNQQVFVPYGIHVNVTSGVLLLGHRVPTDESMQELQNQLFFYRACNRDLVEVSRFRASGLLPELCAVARQLGAAIVDDAELQKGIIELLQEQDEQARVDRAGGLKGVILKAVLFHCHQSDEQQVFAGEIADTVNRIYVDEGESRKVSSETVGHVLKDLGLYSRRLGSAGRGLILDRSTQLRAHKLSSAYEVLPNLPHCGYCHELQVLQSEDVM